MEMHFSGSQSVRKLRILIAVISEVPEDPSVIYVGSGSAHYAYSPVENNVSFNDNGSDDACRPPPLSSQLCFNTINNLRLHYCGGAASP